MKKKILFVIDSLVCGGAEKSLVSLLPLLNRNKYELYIWIIHRGGDFEILLPKDVVVVDSPKYSLLEKIYLEVGQILFSLLLRINKIFSIKEHNAEALWKSIGWAIKVPKGSWNTVIAYQQGLPTYLVANKFSSCKKYAWINVNIFEAGYNIEFNDQFYEKIDNIVSVSEKLYDLLSEKMPKFNSKYTLIYDILNPKVIHDWSLQKVQNLRTSNDETIIVTTGRLVRQKGYDLAIVAAAELKQLGLKFKWYFIGEGGERSCIEQMKQEYGVMKEVVLLGFQKNPYAFMRQADVYVQPSRFEGFGLTIGEAKILGKPIVSTYFDVVNNQLTHGKNGLIVKMDGKSIANAIYAMVTDPILRQNVVTEVMKEENRTFLSEVQKVETLIDC